MVAADQHTPPARAALPGARALVVEARYYAGIADELLAGARAAFAAAGVAVDVATVDGALELPVAIALLLDAAAGAGRPYDMAVALGCVIRGETGHYDIVAGESARALIDLAVARRIPLGNGVLTVETEAQAWARARTAEMNKGGGAAQAAMSVMRAVETWERSALG